MSNQSNSFVERKPLLVDGALSDNFKQALSRYANARSGHPFGDLGQKSILTSATLTPVYRVYRETLFEKRDVLKKTEPFWGSSYKPEDEDALRSFDKWKYPLTGASDYEDAEEQVDLSGKLGCKVYTCPTCNGGKKIVCSSCSGEGKTLCPNCDGRGQSYDSCPECGGSGYIKVRVSSHVSLRDEDGIEKDSLDDEQFRSESCPDCKGIGKRYQTCPECRGQRYYRCPDCGGRGVITCTMCSGSGYLREYRELRSIRSVKRANIISWGSVPDNAGLSLKDSEFGQIIAEGKENHLVGMSVIGWGRLDSIMDSRTAKYSQETDSYKRINGDHFIVWRYDVITIQYTYKNKAYSGLLLEGFFYPITSPITEYSSSLLSKTNELLKEGKISEAQQSAKKVQELGVAQHAQAAEEKINSIQGYFYNYANLGTSVVFWLFALLVLPLVFHFYDSLNPVLPFAVRQNDPNSWLYELVPVIHSFIYLVILLGLKLYIDGLVKSTGETELQHFWSGAGKMALRSFVALIIMLVVNFLGISVITVFIGGVFLRIIGIFLAIIVIILYIIALLVEVIVKLIGLLF